MPPKRYLIAWRLQVAKDKLRAGRPPPRTRPRRRSARSAGAFIRAFKREFGMPPAAWRKQAQPAGG
jgi:AraC-like DNA-binding protein